MRIVLIAVGTPRQPGLVEAIRAYEKRASRYFSFEVIETAGASRHGGDPARARREEGEEVLRRLPRDLETWALTRAGRRMSSPALARRLGEMATYGLPGAAFVVGGAHGLSRGVLEAAQVHLSLSSMTLPHELARLVLVEQIYRAGTILRGEPYHKGAG